MVKQSCNLDNKFGDNHGKCKRNVLVLGKKTQKTEEPEYANDV
jgi:hypothetical protein